MENTDILLVNANSPMEKAAALVELETLHKKVKDKIAIYKADLLKITQDLDVYTLKTGSYTITRAKRITPQIIDFETLKLSLKKEDIPFDVKEVFADYMTEVFKTAIEEKRPLDGLGILETEYIMIRVSKEKNI